MKYFLPLALVASLGLAFATPASAQSGQKKRIAVRSAVLVTAPRRAQRVRYVPSTYAQPSWQNDYVGSVPRGWFRQPSREPSDYRVGSTSWWQAMDARGLGGYAG